MAGKRNMRSQLLHPARAEEIRTKIQSTLIVNKLEKHILEGVEMSTTQVTAALGLLKKSVPDLSSIEQLTEHTGSIQHDVEIRIIDNPS